MQWNHAKVRGTTPLSICRLSGPLSGSLLSVWKSVLLAVPRACLAPRLAPSSHPVPVCRSLVVQLSPSSGRPRRWSSCASRCLCSCLACCSASPVRTARVGARISPAFCWRCRGLAHQFCSCHWLRSSSSSCLLPRCCRCLHSLRRRGGCLGLWQHGPLLHRVCRCRWLQHWSLGRRQRSRVVRCRRRRSGWWPEVASRSSNRQATTEGERFKCRC